MRGFRKIAAPAALLLLTVVGLLSACSSLKPFTQDELSRISGVQLEQTAGRAK